MNQNPRALTPTRKQSAARSWRTLSLRSRETHRLTRPLEFSRFTFTCDCGQRIVVAPSIRMSPTQCSACGKSHGTFGQMPNAVMIPTADASLTDMIRFSNAYNPIPRLRESLGPDYKTYIERLRDRCITAFRAGEQAPGTGEELLICLACEIAIMPHLGISQENATRLCRWFLDGIRRATSV